MMFRNRIAGVTAMSIIFTGLVMPVNMSYAEDATMQVWNQYEDRFTGKDGDYGIVWHKYSGDSDGGQYSFNDGVLTITTDNSEKNPCYGVSALIKNVQGNTKYTITFKEKTDYSEVTNSGHGFYVNSDTLQTIHSNTNPAANMPIASENRNNKKIGTVHNSVITDGDWEEKSFEWTSGSGLDTGYETLVAKFTFISRSAVGTVQIKDLSIEGEALPPAPTPVPAPTKAPGYEQEIPVHTGAAVDYWGTDDVYQYHYAGGTDAYNSGESATGKCYDVYLWVPQNVSPETLRGLIAVKKNLIEVPFMYSVALKKALAEEGFGILFIVNQKDQIPAGYTGTGQNYNNVFQSMYTKTDYKGDPLFTDESFYTYDGKDAGEIFNEMLSGIAQSSGFSCIADKTPIITIGHSAASPFGYRSGNWNYDRIIAQMDLKNGMWGKANATDDREGMGMVPGIPSVQYDAQYSEHGTGATRDRSIYDARYHIDNQRAIDTDQLVSHIIEWGSGHYDWSNNMTAMMIKYIQKAIEYRLNKDANGNPTNYTGGSSEYTLTDLRESGYLMKPFEKDADGNERPTGYYSDVLKGWLSSGQDNANASEADKKQSFWFFDKEFAEEISAFTNYAIPSSPSRMLTGIDGKTHTDAEPYMLMKDPSKSLYADSPYDYNRYISPFREFETGRSKYGDKYFVNYEKMGSPSAGKADPASGISNTGDLRGYDTVTVDTYFMSKVPQIMTTNGFAYDGTGDDAYVPENGKAEVVPIVAPYELVDSELVDMEGMVRDGTSEADNVASVTRSTLRFHNNRVYYSTSCRDTNEAGLNQNGFAMIVSPEIRDEDGNVISQFKCTTVGMANPYVAKNKGGIQTLEVEEISDIDISELGENNRFSLNYTSSDSDLQKYTDAFVEYGPARAIRTVSPDDGSYSWEIEVLPEQIPQNAKYPIEVHVVVSNMGKWEKLSGATASVKFYITDTEPKSFELVPKVSENILTGVNVSGPEFTEADNLYVALYDDTGVLMGVKAQKVPSGGDCMFNMDMSDAALCRIYLWRDMMPLAYTDIK